MNPYKMPEEILEVGFNGEASTINNAAISTSAERSLLSCLKVPATYYDSIDPSFKARVLGEAFERRADPIHAILDKEKTVQGAVPNWKFVANPVRTVSESFANMNLLDADCIDYQVYPAGEFVLSDSKFIVQVFLDAQLYGVAPSIVGLRINREVCANGLTHPVISLSKGTADGFSIDIVAFVKGYSEIAKEVPTLLERSKEMQMSLDSLLVSPWFLGLPKTVQGYSAKYIQRIHEFDEEVMNEFDNDTKDTLYGHLNVVTASARTMRTKNRIKVESAVMATLMNVGVM